MKHTMKKPEKKDIQDILALTPMQEGMLLHYLKFPAGDMYFEQMCLGLEGEIDRNIFKKSWNTVVESNEMLRTVFRWEKVDTPVQLILKENQLDTVFHDFSDFEPSETDKQMVEIKQTDRDKGFDLSLVPFRVILCKTAPSKYQMIISNHHILYDGWSNGIILKEFFTAYDRLQSGEPEGITVEEKSRKGYFKEVVKWMQQQDKTRQAGYWRECLQEFAHKTELPVTTSGTGEKKSLNQNLQREIHRFSIPGTLFDVIDEFTQANKLTLAAFLYTVWGVLLQKYTGSLDVVFGTTVALRSGKIKGIQEMVGLLLNTVPLRVTASGGDDTALGLLKRVAAAVQEREPFETTPLTDINEYGSLESRENLFDSILVIENYPISDRLLQKGGGLSVISYSMLDITEYDLTVDIVTGSGIDISLTYNPALYHDWFIGNMGNHMINIMKAMTGNIDLSLADMDILDEVERIRIMEEFNDNSADFHRDQTVFQRVEHYAEVTPGSPAMVYGDMVLSYAELNRLAEGLAGHLRERGIGPDQLVGVLIDRSHQMAAAILAVWKARGAYIPIDTQYPLNRITDIMNDSGAVVLITRSEHLETIDGLTDTVDAHIVDLDNAEMWQYPPDATPLPDEPMNMDTLAYVIYTSGSTGKPKGAMVEHIGMMNHLQSKINELQLGDQSIIVENASQCFDISVWQFFAALVVGGKTIVYSNEIVLDPDQLMNSVIRDRVTILEVVPSYLSVMLDYCDDGQYIFPDLVYLLVTGETVKPQLIHRWFEKYPDIPVVNAYGPTEASDDITHYVMREAPRRERVPIGRTIQNFNIYIVDDHMNICPVGVKGEILVAGVGVGRGYLGDEEKTKKAFMEDPFSGKAGNGKAVRLYRTGDLGCWLPDGNIDFFGRKDYQVKIKGFRIELGEIENHLMKFDGLNEAVVNVVEQPTGNGGETEAALCAYIVAVGAPESEKEKTAVTVQLKEFLADSLPDYMIPSYFVHMNKLPLTPNGKINRKVLPMPDMSVTTDTYVAPANELEEAMAEIWADILALEKETVGVEDDFFEKGGHSLKVTTLAARIHKTFDVKIPVADVFRLPTIRGLAKFISEVECENKNTNSDKYHWIEPAPKQEDYPLSLAQRRLFILNEIGQVDDTYNLPAVWLLEGEIDRDRFEQAFKQLIERHESLRTSFQSRDNESVQVIHNHVHFHIDYMELPGTIQEKKEEIDTLIDSFLKPFDLSQPPLLRVRLVQMAADRHLLFYDMHHIISDGVTIVVLARDFIRFYDGREQIPLRIQYKDFAVWQLAQADSPEMKQQEAYWLNRFRDGVPVLQFPLDFPRPKLQVFKGGSVSFVIDKSLTAKIRNLVAEGGYTLYIVLLAAYNILLSLYSQQEDIVVGLPIAGRNHADLEDVVGFFVNTLVMRNQPKGSMTVGSFLDAVKTTALEAYENQNYPFEQLVNKLKLPRDLSRNPLFDAMFVLQNMDPFEEFADLKMVPYEFERKISHFDMHLQAFEQEDTIDMALEFCTALFKRSTITGITGHYLEILDQVASDQTVKINEIKIKHGLAAADTGGFQEEPGGFDF